MDEFLPRFPIGPINELQNPTRFLQLGVHVGRAIDDWEVVNEHVEVDLIREIIGCGEGVEAAGEGVEAVVGGP